MTRSGADRRRIDAARAELVELVERLRRLDSDPTRQLLVGTALTGPSAPRWSAVDAELAGLWAAAVALTDRFDELDDLLRGPPRHRRRWTMAANRLLSDPGVELTATAVHAHPSTAGPAGAGPRDLPCLLSDMHDCLDRAETTVARASWSWTTARTSLTQARERLVQAAVAAQHRHVRVPATVRQTVASLEAMEAHASTDPFDVDPEHVDSLLLDARTRQDELSAAMAHGAAFDQRHATVLDELEATSQLIAGVRIRCTDVRRRVAVPTCSNAALDELDRRLLALREDVGALLTVAAVDWVATDRRLSTVEQGLQGLHRDVRSVQDDASAALAERDVLRGRLSAYRARAARSNRAEDRSLAAQHAAALEALHRVPVDLHVAADLVRAYVDGLEHVEAQP